MRIVGIDPGLASVGWGCIAYPEGGPDQVRWGVIKTSADQMIGQRLRRIHDLLGALLDELHAEAVVVEELFFAANVKTAVIVAQARGVVLLTASEKQLETVQYTPLQIKKAVTGHGRASKSQVQRMVATLLGLSEIPRPDHAADALAAALCHGHTLKADRLIRRA